MLYKFLAVASLATSALAAWAPTEFQYNVDNSTYANADMIHTTHMHLDWVVDFNQEKLIAQITHDMEVLKPTNYVVFDSWLIDVLECEQLTSGAARRLRDLGPYTAENEAALGSTVLSYDISVVNPDIGDALTCHFD